MKAFHNLIAGILIVVAALLLCAVSTHTNFLSWVTTAPFNTAHPSIPALPGQAQAQAASPFTVVGEPTISASSINAQLCLYHSPACGTGQALYDLGVKYGIDPVFPLAFFLHESQYATTGMARVTHSVGNSRCIPGVACVNQQGAPCLAGQQWVDSCYASFSTFPAGYESWYRLITSKTYAGGGRTTVEQIVPVYAPAADNNNVVAYISAVETSVTAYRSASSK